MSYRLPNILESLKEDLLISGFAPIDPPALPVLYEPDLEGMYVTLETLQFTCRASIQYAASVNP